MKQRFYVVLDVEGNYPLEPTDVASWLCALNKQDYEHELDPTVYAELHNIVRDCEERDGPFEEPA